MRKVGGQGHPLGPDGLLHKAETKHLSWNPKERLSLREWAGLWVLRSSHVTIGKYEMTYLVGLFRGVAHVVLGAGSSMVSMNLESQGQAVVGGGKTAAVVAICLFCPGQSPTAAEALALSLPLSSKPLHLQVRSTQFPCSAREVGLVHL